LSSQAILNIAWNLEKRVTARWSVFRWCGRAAGEKQVVREIIVLHALR
jgi:hypothetical protein